MKRALSLIIVLAMVLCMIPFSAFAADWNVSTDFVDGVINLPASEEVSYLWTATEDGTLEIYAEPVLPEVAEGEEAPAVAQPYILVDGADYTAPIEVKAGESYEIAFGDEAMIGGEVTVYTVFKGLPGTETNPYEMYNPATGMGDGNNTTVSVEPGASVYYTLYYYANTIVKISGAGVKVVKGEETVDGTEAGYVEFNFAPFDRVVTIKITNKDAAAQTYTIEGIVPVGTMDNPEVVPAGEYQTELAAANQGYYYTYIAEGDGVVNVNVYAQDAEGNTLGTMLCVNNLTSYIYGDQTTDGAWSVDVSTGDQIQIMVATFNEADPWNAPAGTVTTVIAFSEAEPEPETGIEWGSVLNGVTSHSNETEAEVLYTYVAEKDGALYRSDYGFNMFVTAGDKVNIIINPGETVELYYATPVAMIGEVEYYYFDEAVASAVAGDTIVLKSDIVADMGVTLPKGVNLDLGAYTLTIPYLVALKGSVITGNLGNAKVITEDLIANNVVIEDVEYAWTESEGGYILDVYKAPVVGTEEPIVAEFGGEQMGLNAALAAAAASAPTADNRAVVTLIADATVDYTVVISPYVTLNIAGYKLTAPNVIGLTNSMINAAAPTDTTAKVANGGKIYVPSKANMVMSAEIHAGSKSGCKLMPVWNADHYLFTNIKNASDTISDAIGQQGYESYTKCSIVMVKHTWSDAGVKKLINNKDGDASESALTFTYKASWNYYDIIDVSQVYVMTGVYVDAATNGSAYGGDTGEIDGLVEFKIQSQVVSDTGAIFYGNMYEIA